MIFSRIGNEEESCELLPGQQITLVRQNGTRLAASVTDVSDGGFGFAAAVLPDVGESVLVRAGRCPEFVGLIRWTWGSRAGAQIQELHATSAACA